MFLRIVLLFTMCCASRVWSQNHEAAKGKSALFLDINLGYGWPQGLLAERFGNNQSVGLGLSYEPARYHFPIGFKWTYMFGNEVREDVLAPYRTSDLNQIIGEDGFQTDVVLRERMFVLQAYTGGIFPLGSQKHAKHGIRWSLGCGFLQHRIRIQDDSRAAGQIDDVFRAGHDRLTNGFALTSFAGYEYRSFSGRINFYAGFEPVIGFTESRRSYNYDVMRSDLGVARRDVLLQFKLGWHIPYFLGNYGEEIEY